MTEINGEKYSTKQFDDYEFRVMFDVEVLNSSFKKEPWNLGYTLTIYTTEKKLENIIRNIEERTSEKVESIIFLHSATKEQDDLTSKFIEETLKDW